METEVLPPSGAIKWTPRERECWLELFTLYTEAITTQCLDENRGLNRFDVSALKDGIRLAAELADAAMEEVQYRGWKHPHQPKTHTSSRRARR